MRSLPYSIDGSSCTHQMLRARTTHRLAKSVDFHNYTNTVLELQTLDLSGVSEPQLKAFFINIYNGIALHGLTVLGSPSTPGERAAFFDERLTDVDLISSEEDRIPCHQVIICSQSEVFRTMMTIGMLESHRSEIFIQNASTDTLQKVNNNHPI